MPTIEQNPSERAYRELLKLGVVCFVAMIPIYVEEIPLLFLQLLPALPSGLFLLARWLVYAGYSGFTCLTTFLELAAPNPDVRRVMSDALLTFNCGFPENGVEGAKLGCHASSDRHVAVGFAAGAALLYVAWLSLSIWYMLLCFRLGQLLSKLFYPPTVENKKTQ